MTGRCSHPNAYPSFSRSPPRRNVNTLRTDLGRGPFRALRKVFNNLQRPTAQRRASDSAFDSSDEDLYQTFIQMNTLSTGRRNAIVVAPNVLRAAGCTAVHVVPNVLLAAGCNAVHVVPKFSSHHNICMLLVRTTTFLKLINYNG